MALEIRIGDRVQIFLDSRFGEKAGWYEGRVFGIEPYSEHRSFYWVELEPRARALLGISQISVFNPKNIRKME